MAWESGEEGLLQAGVLRNDLYEPYGDWVLEVGDRLTRPRRKEELGVIKTHSGLELCVWAES